MIRWARHEVINRIGWLLMGLLSIWRGWSFVWPGARWPSVVQPQILDIAASSIPLWLYATVWVVAGLVAVIAAFWVRARPIATALNFGMYLIWFLASIGAWFFLGSARVWVTALTYACYGWLVIVLGSRNGT